jgi:endonuclease-8
MRSAVRSTPKTTTSMPEGDTIFRAARTLHRLLEGQVVTRFESMFPALTRIDDDRHLVGRTIDSVSSRGKHLLMAFSGGLILRTHMRMNGTWHVYPAGARWQRRRDEMRVLVATADVVAVAFNVPVAEFVTARELARHRALATLGPDLLDPAFDRTEAIRRIRGRADTPVGDVLLDQSTLAGIGNVFKSEILFLAGADPFAPIRALSDAAIQRLVDVAVDQLRANVLTPAQTLSTAFGRRTTRSLDPREKLWVYGRGGRPCRRCGTAIASRAAGADARLTYWCPQCQAAPVSLGDAG